MWLRLPAGLLVDVHQRAVYNCDTARAVRIKHALLLVATPLFQPLNVVASTLGRVGGASVAVARGSLWEAGRQLAFALGTPALLGVMMGSALVGLAHPFLGRAGYGWAEQFLCFRLAPCFAPLAGLDGPLEAAHLLERDRQQHLLQRDLAGVRW